ncbi:retrovirus-related pol polyprotein from transposon TNT 1-94 [Tanacetum coccineum]
MVLEQDSLSPGPQSLENVPQVAETVTTSNELELLYSPMFSELLNGTSHVVSKSSAVHAADNLDKLPTSLQMRTLFKQKPIHKFTVIDDEFINIFKYNRYKETRVTSSRHVDTSNMHTFYQHHPSAQRWTKDHPLEQVIGNPSESVRTRRQLETDGEMCMFALTVSQTEPKNIKEAMADSAWIESMQEELHQFDRLDFARLEVYDCSIAYAGTQINLQISRKALYGLKQAPRAWYDELSNFLVSNGFSKGSIDPTLFITKHREDILLVQIYVDDIIFGSTNPNLSKRFGKLMHSKFDMSMMGELKFFLGIQIHQSPRGIFINQAKYAQEILKKHGMTSCDSIGTPMATKHLDADLSGTPVDQTKYPVWFEHSVPNSKVTKDIFGSRGLVSDHVKSTLVAYNFYGGDKLVSWSSKKQDCTSMLQQKRVVSLSACCAQKQFLSYALSWKPCQGDSLNLPDHRAQVDQGSQIKMIHVKEMMQDNDLKNSKSKDKGSRSRSQSMNEQSHYKQDKTKTRQSINVKSHIFNVIGGTEEFEERDLNIGGDC